MNDLTTRRAFVRSASGLLWLLPGLGCSHRPPAAHDPASPPGEAPPAVTSAPVAAASSAPPGAPAPLPSPPVACRVTEANILGPYWRPGAPFREDITEPGLRGKPLLLRGRVLAAGCSDALAGAELDFWQADGDGHYDNDGSLRLAPGAMRLRGKAKARPDGSFQLRTVIPGRYLNGKQYRPAHIHVRVTAAGFAPLTTQLYFPDDPYNDIDPFIHRSLIMHTEPGGPGQVGTYDIVLAPA